MEVKEKAEVEEVKEDVVKVGLKEGVDWKEEQVATEMEEEKEKVEVEEGVKEKEEVEVAMDKVDKVE